MTAASSSAMARVGELGGGLGAQVVEPLDLDPAAGGGREVVGAGVDQEHVGEVGGLVEPVGDALEALGVGDEHGGARVLQAVEDLVGLPPAVEPDEDGAARHRGPEREAPLGVVLAEDRHPVAGADAAAVGEGAGHAVGLLDEAAEAVAAVAVDEEGGVVAPLDRGLRDLAERPHAVLVDLQRAAEDVLGHDLEHPPGPVSWARTSARLGIAIPLVRSADASVSGD